MAHCAARRTLASEACDQVFRSLTCADKLDFPTLTALEGLHFAVVAANQPTAAVLRVRTQGDIHGQLVCIGVERQERPRLGTRRTRVY